MNVENVAGDDTELLLPWFVNGTLSAKEHAAVEQHLEDCTGCREALRELQMVSAAVEQEHTTPLIPEPPVEQFLQDALSEKASDAVPSRMRWFAAAASVLLLVAAGYLGLSLLPEANVFRTVTDPSGTAEISYVFDITAAEIHDASIRAAIDDAFAESKITAAEDGYRLTVSMPSATMKELNEFADMLRQIEGVQQVEIIGVQLPLE